MQPIVSPSFADWQKARGITPWSTIHGFNRVAAAIKDFAELVISVFERLVAAMTFVVEQVTEFVEAFLSVPVDPTWPTLPPLRHGP